MILYGLRLLVALLTFGFGVAAAWLFNCDSPKSSGAQTASIESLRTEYFLNHRPVTESGILQQKTIDKDSPAYPFYAKKVRISGTVVVRVEVDEDGRVVKAQARGGYAMLPEAAERDAMETRFAPTLGYSGKPMRVTGYIMYKYVLD